MLDHLENKAAKFIYFNYNNFYLKCSFSSFCFFVILLIVTSVKGVLKITFINYSLRMINVRSLEYYIQLDENEEFDFSSRFWFI